MSIQKHKGHFIPTCDICGETLEECESHSDAVSLIRVEGWSSEKQIDGSWNNYCRECDNA